MHDMSNTRKEIAARLGFAARFGRDYPSKVSETAGASGGTWSKKMARYGSKKAAVMTYTDGGQVGQVYQDPDNPRVFKAFDMGGRLLGEGSEMDMKRKVEAINASRPGAKAEFAAHPSWSEGILGKDTDPKLAAYSWISKNNIESGRKQMLLADLAAGMYEKNPSMSIAQAVLAAAKDMVSKGVATRDIQQWAENGGKFARPGAKTRMTREQTEEQKAGLKIMSAADPAVGAKIATLIKEGKPQDQAVAIALDMKRRGEL